MSKSVILGSKEAFDLRSVPFSIKGSYVCVLEDAEDRSLYLSITRSPTTVLQRKNLVKIVPVLDNKELPFEYEATPEKLTIKTFCGTIDICFAAEKQMRIRGEGVGLRFCFKTKLFENASPNENGDMETAFVLIGKLLFVPLKGVLQCSGTWIPSKAKAEDYDINLLPSTETKMFETAIHEYLSNGWRDEKYASFEDCVSSSKKAFEAFKKDRFPKTSRKYEKMADLAAWTVWTHTMRPEGNIKDPAIYMSRMTLSRVSAWQQSFHAMAVAGSDMKEAWRLLLSMFDYQNEDGQLPDTIGEIGISYKAPKPVFQGFALLYILSRGDTGVLKKKDYEVLYEKLSKYTNWWLAKRDRSGSGLPQYYLPGESGWDDASIFREGVPLHSGDLLAHMVMATEACSVLSEKMGDTKAAARWAKESKRLLSVLVDEFWDGEQFISRVVETGEVVDTKSVVTLLPILLGKRLPKKIVDKIAERLSDEEEFMTTGGIVSEAIQSSKFKLDKAFMRGGIVAPVQLLLAMGLKDAGKKELSQKIASRYCDLVCEKGLSISLSPYVFDISTGQYTKKQDAYKEEEWDRAPDRFKKEKKEPETVNDFSSWAASSFLLIAADILGE